MEGLLIPKKGKEKGKKETGAQPSVQVVLEGNMAGLLHR